MNDFIHLDRLAEAKAAAEMHFAQGFDNPQFTQPSLGSVGMQDDQAAAEKQLQWYAGRPEEYLGLEYQASHARMLGHLRQSRDLLQHAAALARGRGLPDVAERLLSPDANSYALLGDCATAVRANPTFANFANSLQMLVFCGNDGLIERAEKCAEEMSQRRGENLLWHDAQLLQIRAAIEFGHGQLANAIELLRSVAPYERAFTFAVYLRGLAFLRLKQGGEAAAEFQKIVDHRSANWGLMYPLSYLGLAREAALAGDIARARNAYEIFFSLWKDADPDIAVLIKARKEFSELTKPPRTTLRNPAWL